jgi:hypothetical protein
MAKYKIRLHDIGVHAKEDKKFTKSYDDSEDLVKIGSELKEKYQYDTFYIEPARKRTKKV